MTFRLLRFLLIFTNLNIVLLKNEPLITVKVKSVKCDHVNPEIYNGTVQCSVKPTRDGKGVTKVRYFYGKPASDLWVQAKLYYRFLSGTQFRPWMVDVDVDVCNVLQDQSLLNGFASFMAKSVRKNAPTLIHSCPYVGEEGLKDGDVDAIMGGTFPQIIPKGLYQMLLRFHLKNNETFLNVFVTASFDAVDPLKAFDMGK